MCAVIFFAKCLHEQKCSKLKVLQFFLLNNMRGLFIISKTAFDPLCQITLVFITDEMCLMISSGKTNNGTLAGDQEKKIRFLESEGNSKKWHRVKATAGEREPLSLTTIFYWLILSENKLSFSYAAVHFFSDDFLDFHWEGVNHVSTVKYGKAILIKNYLKRHFNLLKGIQIKTKIIMS